MEGAANAKSPHEYYVLLHASGSVRSGKWKYYPWPEGAGNNNKKKKNKNKQDADAADDTSAKPKVQLYDLSSDLSETKNIADAHPEIVAEMQKAFDALKQDIAQNKRPLANAE
jgi:arylsulfatase A